MSPIDWLSGRDEIFGVGDAEMEKFPPYENNLAKKEENSRISGRGI